MRESLKLTLVSAAAQQPVTLAEAKAQLRIEDDASEDALISAYIASATALAEEFLGRALISQTWRLFLDDWPSKPGRWADDDWEGTREGPITMLQTSARAIELPKAPLQSITHLKTFNDSDAETTVATSVYFVDTASDPGRLVLRTGQAVPVAERVANAYEVEFVAGYGDSPHNVPEPIRQGILLTVEKLYEGCEAQNAMEKASAKTVMQPYRVMRV